MLWVFFLVGFVGTVIFLNLTISGVRSRDRNQSRVIIYAKLLGIFIVVALIGVFGFIEVQKYFYNENIQTKQWKLVSLTDKSAFVYVSKDKDKGVYSFYYQLDDGEIRSGEVEEYKTTIYENENCEPCIVQKKNIYKNKMNKVLLAVLVFGEEKSIFNTYEIYIPAGTILETHSLDSQ